MMKGRREREEYLLQLGPENLADKVFLLLGKIGGQGLSNPKIRVGLNQGPRMEEVEVGGERCLSAVG